MAIEYEVKVSRSQPESGGYTSGSQSDEIKTQWTINYDVYVSDPADPNFDGSSVGVFDILGLRTAAQTTNGVYLPTVNASIWIKDGKMRPYLVCQSKQATRDPRKSSHWTVTTRFGTGSNASTSEGDNDQEIDPPAAVTDITPRVEVRFGQRDQVRYDDQDGKQCLTPTKNYFTEPFIEKIGTQVLIFHVYTPSISFDTIQSRLFKLNNAVFRGKAKWAWMILDIEATEVEILLEDPVDPILNPPVPTTAALTKYTVEYTGAVNGWLDDRALIDTHYLTGGSPANKVPFADDALLTFTSGLIETDGTLRDQSLIPAYEQFRMQPDTNFSSFLPNV